MAAYVSTLDIVNKKLKKQFASKFLITDFT